MMHPGIQMSMGQRVGSQQMYGAPPMQGQPYPYGAPTMAPQMQAGARPQMMPQAAPQAAPRPTASAPLPAAQTAPAPMPTVSGAVPPPSFASAPMRPPAPQATQMAPQAAQMAPQAAQMAPKPSGGSPMGAVRPAMGSVAMTREQALDKEVSELRSLISQRDDQIKDLQQKLGKYEGKGSYGGAPSAAKAKVEARGAVCSGFRKLTGSVPSSKYEAVDQNDPVDVRLEEFYNSTGSAVPFQRINRGFYRFGGTIAELDIINHKLMARTEDGWNRGKFGPIDKFVGYYENIERDRAGIEVDMS